MPKLNIKSQRRRKDKTLFKLLKNRWIKYKENNTKIRNILVNITFNIMTRIFSNIFKTKVGYHFFIDTKVKRKTTNYKKVFKI